MVCFRGIARLQVDVYRNIDSTIGASLGLYVMPTLIIGIRRGQDTYSAIVDAADGLLGARVSENWNKAVQPHDTTFAAILNAVGWARGLGEGQRLVNRV
jgi:hypothetical protein